MTDADSLFFDFFFGAIGTGYFIYGKNNARLVPLLAGLALCVFPYFITGGIAMIAVGTALAVTPWFLRQDS